MSWSAHAVATTNKFIKKETLAIMRKRVMLSMLQKAGRIVYNQSGEKLQWPVRMKRTPLESSGEGASYSFARKDRRKKAIVDWKRYHMTEAIYEFDLLKNRGAEAIVKLWSDKVNILMDDFKDQLPVELVQTDGNAAASLTKFDGLATLFAGNTSSAGNLVGTNVATYAGLSTARGYHGGSFTGTWPRGTASGPEYDFWSPLDVDVTNTGWSATTDTPANTLPEAMRFAIINTQRNGDKLDYILFDKIYYEAFLNALDEKERINVTKGSGESQLVKAGFTAVNYDGVDVTWGDEVDSNKGYGICNDAFRLNSMQSQLIMAKEDEDLETLSERVILRAYGNTQYENPRSLCRFSSLTA